MKFLFLPIAILAILMLPNVGGAQSNGQWVTCLDPGGSGHLVSCFVPNSTQSQAISQQVVVIVNQPAAEPSRYRQNQPRSIYHSQPVSEVQQRQVVRRGCDYGIDRYSGRFYANCANTVETETIRASTTNARIPINIRVGNSTGGYSGPIRSGW